MLIPQMGISIFCLLIFTYIFILLILMTLAHAYTLGKLLNFAPEF